MIIWFAGNIGQSDRYAEPILRHIPRRLLSYYNVVEKKGVEFTQLSLTERSKDDEKKAK